MSRREDHEREAKAERQGREAAEAGEPPNVPTKWRPESPLRIAWTTGYAQVFGGRAIKFSDGSTVKFG